MKNPMVFLSLSLQFNHSLSVCLFHISAVFKLIHISDLKEEKKSVSVLRQFFFRWNRSRAQSLKQTLDPFLNATHIRNSSSKTSRNHSSRKLRIIFDMHGPELTLNVLANQANSIWEREFAPRKSLKKQKQKKTKNCLVDLTWNDKWIHF